MAAFCTSFTSHPQGLLYNLVYKWGLLCKKWLLFGEFYLLRYHLPNDSLCYQRDRLSSDITHSNELIMLLADILETPMGPHRSSLKPTFEHLSERAHAADGRCKRQRGGSQPARLVRMFGCNVNRGAGPFIITWLMHNCKKRGFDTINSA